MDVIELSSLAANLSILIKQSKEGSLKKVIKSIGKMITVIAFIVPTLINSVAIS